MMAIPAQYVTAVARNVWALELTNASHALTAVY